MKGDVGMSFNEKKGNKRMPTPKQKLIHNPIPISLFVVCLCKHTFGYNLPIEPAVSSSSKRHISETKKDVLMVFFENTIATS